jgi:hypothetical protein
LTSESFGAHFAVYRQLVQDRSIVCAGLRHQPPSLTAVLKAAKFLVETICFLESESPASSRLRMFRGTAIGTASMSLRSNNRRKSVNVSGWRYPALLNCAEALLSQIAFVSHSAKTSTFLFDANSARCCRPALPTPTIPTRNRSFAPNYSGREGN